MALPEIPDFDYVTVHTKFNVIMTTYSWSRGGQKPSWSRRWPAFGNGLVDRRTQAYGEQVAAWCNTYNVDCLCGYYQAVSDNPLANFRTSLGRAGNLGNVKLLHMFGLGGFPVKRGAIENEVKNWAAEIQSPKYARIRDANGTQRPILMFWGDELRHDWTQFVDMIGAIRSYLGPRVGQPFIIGTDHLIGYVATGVAGAVNALRAIDGVYNHACGLPWDTCGGCDKSGVEWDAVQSAQQLTAMLRPRRDTTLAHGKIYFGGTMPHFDRDLFERDGLANQGRVVAKGGQQLRQLLLAAKAFAPVVYSESRQQADGEHIYEDRWIVLTSLNEWEEGSTFEPCLVRGSAYTAPSWDYGTDGLQAVSEVFRDTVTRRRLRSAA
jgi:hypothetical protein